MSHQVQIPGLNFTVDWNDYNEAVTTYYSGPWNHDPGPLAEFVYNWFANKKQFLTEDKEDEPSAGDFECTR